MDDFESGENETCRSRGAEFVAGLGTVSVAVLANGDYDKDCPICQSSYGSTDPAQVSCCGRAFHKNCLTEWLSEGQSNTCPICRAELFEKPEEEMDEEDGIGGPDQEGEGETGEISEGYAFFVGEDFFDGPDEWRPDDDMDSDDDMFLSNQSDEYVLKQLRTGRRHKWGYLGHRYQYQMLLVDGANLPPLDPETSDLTIEQDLALFRELQRRGCFKVEGMRCRYWERNGWGDFRTYEHLAERGTLWCTEHRRWFRIGPYDPHRHLIFDEL